MYTNPSGWSLYQAVYEKAPEPTLSMQSGIVILLSSEQPEKAAPSILIMLSGIIMLVRHEQLQNAPYPIFLRHSV